MFLPVIAVPMEWFTLESLVCSSVVSMPGRGTAACAGFELINVVSLGSFRYVVADGMDVASKARTGRQTASTAMR